MVNLDKINHEEIVAKLENKSINIYKNGLICEIGHTENNLEIDDTVVKSLNEIMKTYIAIEKEYLFESILILAKHGKITLTLIEIALRYICNPVDITNIDATVNEFLEEDITNEEKCFIASMIVLFKNNGICLIDNINNKLVELNKKTINVDDIITSINKIKVLSDLGYSFDKSLDIISKEICTVSYNIGNTQINSHILIQEDGNFYGIDDLKRQPIIGKIIDNKFLCVYYIGNEKIKKYIGYYNGEIFVMSIDASNVKTGFNFTKDVFVLQKRAIFYNEIETAINSIDRKSLFNILKEINDYSNYILGIRVISARLGLHDAKTLILN